MLCRWISKVPTFLRKILFPSSLYLPTFYSSTDSHGIIPRPSSSTSSPPWDEDPQISIHSDHAFTPHFFNILRNLNSSLHLPWLFVYLMAFHRGQSKDGMIMYDKYVKRNKIFPLPTCRGHGEEEIFLLLILDLCTISGNWSTHAPAALQRRYPLDRRQCGSQSWSQHRGLNDDFVNFKRSDYILLQFDIFCLLASCAFICFNVHSLVIEAF
jgi:hypothetical protein